MDVRFVLKDQLQYFLRARGMTASALARRAGVPKQSLSDWLAGASPRKIDHLKRVSQVLGVTIDHLCFGKGEPPESQSSTHPSLESLLDRGTEGLFEIKLRRIDG